MYLVCILLDFIKKTRTKLGAISMHFTGFYKKKNLNKTRSNRYKINCVRVTYKKNITDNFDVLFDIKNSFYSIKSILSKM